MKKLYLIIVFSAPIFFFIRASHHGSDSVVVWMPTRSLHLAAVVIRLQSVLHMGGGYRAENDQSLNIDNDSQDSVVGF